MSVFEKEQSKVFENLINIKKAYEEIENINIFNIKQIKRHSMNNQLESYLFYLEKLKEIYNNLECFIEEMETNKLFVHKKYKVYISEEDYLKLQYHVKKKLKDKLEEKLPEKNTKNKINKI